MRELSGYTLRDRIYESGNTLVFRAYRNADELGVVIKTPHDEYPPPEHVARYHREFSIFLSEINVHAHWNDRHGQDTDWTDYNADFSLLNGRAWPDTIQPNGNARSTAAGRLQYNPLSSLIQGAAGERVLLRIANLGFQEHSLLLPGLPMTVIGRDAKPQVADRHSAVCLHLFSDDPDAPARLLGERGIPYEAQQRRLRLTPDSHAEFPALLFAADDTAVDLTIFSHDELRQPPLDRIDGKPMQRATRAALENLLG